jgi:hypothetical protein
VILSESVNQQRTYEPINELCRSSQAEADPAAKPIAAGPLLQVSHVIESQTGGERLPMTKLTKNRTKNTTNRIQAI